MIHLGESLDLTKLKDALDSRKEVDGTLLEDGLLTVYLSDGSTYQVTLSGSNFFAKGLAESGDSLGSFKSNSVGQVVLFVVGEK